jgi:hypothetical protein
MNIASLPATVTPAPTASDKIIKEMQDNNDELEQSLTPKQSVEKHLIEAMFTKDKDKKTDDAIKTPYQQKEPQANSDSVTLSRQALDLQASSKTQATVTIKNADGSTITVSVSHEEKLHIQAGAAQEAPKSSDPLIIDLDGNGVQLTDVTKGHGVRFDINGDTLKENVSWAAPQDGILAYDQNGNGVIDSGKELFGDQNGAANGFDELAKYDTDKNGSIDTNDAIFSKLSVWQDKNQNGISEVGELKGLSSYGITRINLNAAAANFQSGGNTIAAVGSYESTYGKGQIAEANLNYLG